MAARCVPDLACCTLPHRSCLFSFDLHPHPRLNYSGCVWWLRCVWTVQGINLWASADHGLTFTRFNLAAEHNRQVSAAGNSTLLRYDAQVVNADGPKAGRALPEPETSSYTGLAEAADGALVICYDRIANGWKGPPGVWGDFDAMFTMRATLTTTAAAVEGEATVAPAVQAHSTRPS